MSYLNFKDPLGLLKRMLLSRNKIAYWILFREFFSKCVIPIDLFLSFFEKGALKETKESPQPVILILGGSRSGTTLLYQTLVHHLPVSYISNFIASFPRSPITTFRLFNKIIPKTRKSFKSYYGSAAGLGGPNDAFMLWNRWLGQDRNHIPKTISKESKLDMRRFFDSWSRITKKPFLNKNNRNSLCAPLFDQILPNTFFVEIHRNPIFVAQSLILSRRAIQGSNNIGWGLLSEDSKKDEDPLSYIDDICSQVHEVNKILAKGREKIDAKKYIRVSYEDFCENPAELIQIVGLKALNLAVDYSDLAHLKFSAASNQKRLNDEEFNRICYYFEKLNKKEKTPNITTGQSCLG